VVIVDVERPAAVRVLKVLLVLTAAATVVVEVLNYWYAPEHGFGLAVRTGWAMLRAFGFLILVWHVHRGRAAAKPLDVSAGGLQSLDAPGDQPDPGCPPGVADNSVRSQLADRRRDQDRGSAAGNRPFPATEAGGRGLGVGWGC